MFLFIDIRLSQITDFGISLKATDLKLSLAREEDLEGTLFYLAPEVFSEKVFSRESDGALDA